MTRSNVKVLFECNKESKSDVTSGEGVVSYSERSEKDVKGVVSSSESRFFPREIREKMSFSLPRSRRVNVVGGMTVLPCKKLRARPRWSPRGERAGGERALG